MHINHLEDYTDQGTYHDRLYHKWHRGAPAGVRLSKCIRKCHMTVGESVESERLFKLVMQGTGMTCNA